MPQIIRTRTIVYKILGVALDAFVYNEAVRRVRNKMKRKCNKCFSCNKNFADEEKISVIFTSKGNRVVCRECAIRFKNELNNSDDI